MTVSGTNSEFVPLSRPYTVGQRDKVSKKEKMSGTRAGQIDLKALAHKVLQRDNSRDNIGTSAEKIAGQKGVVCPKSVPQDLKGLGNNLRLKYALDRAIESLLPAGRMERLATMTDAEIDAYAGRFGVSGKDLIAAIFDPVRNAEYLKAHGGKA